MPEQFIRSGSDNQFYSRLVSLLIGANVTPGAKNFPFPRACGYPIDLRLLHNCMVSEGGLERVSLAVHTTFRTTDH